MGNYIFYITTGYTTSSAPKEHLTRLEINVTAPLPQISTISKYSFSADDQIIITGTNFGTSQKSVRFYNNRDGIILSWTDTQIICKVPNGVQSGDVFVINDNGTSNGIPYNVVSSTGDPIVVQPIPDQSMNQNSSLIIANLNNVFSDPNNDVLVFTATSSSSNITTSIDGGNLILTSNSLATGSSQITVSAVDLDNVTIQDVFKITIINPSPLIEETPVSLASFGNVQVGLNSIPQYYSISGSNLSDNININAPPGFQVSLISSTGFGNSLILSQSGGIVTNTTIYVIFSPNSNGTYSTSITNASTGANTQIVSVKGTGFSIPSIVALPTSLSFGNVVVNTNSSPQSYDVSGTNLTDNITITAPTGYQISLSTNTGFVNAITLPQSDGTVENIPVYVRFSPTSLTNYSGNVLNVSVGATIQSVALTGTGVSTPNAPIIGQITQPICSVATGSVVLSGFPPSETWTITMTPGGVITSGTGTSIVISELAAGTYFFTVTNSSGYISPASADVIINPQPNPLTIQASSIVFSSISNNDMTVSWTRGDGNSVLVVARAGSAVNTDPVNGTLYSANANFGGGSQIGTGNYVVYNGTGSSINLTGLAAGTDYHYAIYEYNTSGFCYKAPALTGNTSTTNTCTPPTTQASSIAFSSISSYYMTVSWTRGSGDLVLVVAREGSAVNAGPLNGSSSIAAANFGYGTQFGTGNYVVYFGNGSSVDLGGLKAGTDYHFAIYECSNNMDFCYKTPALTGDETTSNTSSYPYCLAGSADQNYEYISNVTMGNINQSSGRGNAGYENYTSNSTTMQIGINTFATIDVTYPVATDQILIWIDWNKDNDFDEPGENVYSSSGSFVNPHITANFAPPVGAAIGTTRMRIRLHDASFKSNSTPCGDAGYGEVEDYSINVIPGCSPSSAPAITLTQPNCTTSNGSITISSPTGTGITYSIDGLNYINTTGVFTNVLPGTYTVTARNSGGCISSGTIVTINLQPVTPTAPIVSLVQPTCTEANGTLTVISPTGTGMTYSVNGITFTNTTGVFIVPPGSLATVAAKSAEGCISPITPITINAQPLPPASPVQTTDCSLGSGNATVTVTNPTGTGFQYSLDGGVYQASVTFTGVLNGSHSITVRNSSGCTTTGGSFSVSCGCANGPSLALNSISGSTCGTTPVTVSGNTFSNATLVTITENGAGIVTPSSSGTSPFAFTYTPGAGDAGNTVIITITTDNPLGSPCAAAVATYTLSVNAVPNTPTIGTITQPTCLLPTGSVVLNGLPAGNWTINPGGITGTGSSTTLTGLTAGTYIFTVTSNAGCTSQSSSSVVINSAPGAPTAPLVTFTQLTCTTSNGSITISSPTGTGITYSIDGLNYINTTGVFTNVLPGTYTVTARNSGGCISSGTIVTINLQPVTPTAPIVSLVQPTCTEANGTLTVISPTGTGMTYSVNGITFTNTTGVFIVPPGSLATVAAKSAEGCISPITPITINAQPLPPASPVQTTDCSLGSGNATVTVTNPTGTGFQYSLDGGVYQASVTFTGVLNGSHSITVRNSSGCTTTGGSFSVSCGCANGPSLALNSISGSTCGTTPVTVSGNTFSNATLVTITENGAGIVTPSSSGTSPFAFTYTPGAGDAGNTVIITITTDNPLGSPCAAAVATYTLSVNAVPNTPTIGTITQPTCLLPTGSVVLNGLPAGNWTINPGGITGTGSSTTLTGLTAGTYIFTVTSNAGCTSQSSSSVVINSAPGAPTAPIPGTITQPTCALATGSVVLNGLPAGNWTINPGSIAGNTASTTIPGQVPGTYTFIVTNAAGCTSPASINVIIVSNPATPFAPIVGTITQPTCVLRTGSVELNGLPAGNWTINPGGITGTSSSTAITGLIAGTYIYTVTNNAGCTSDASLDININEAKIGYMPKIAVKYNDILICYNLDDSIQSYQWFKDLNLVPDATSQYYQTHKYPGTYYVITTDLGGCENASNSITIEGKKSMSVYPNPASYSIALTFENVSEGGGVVSIYNSAGVKMMVYHVESVKDDFLKEIPIYNLEKGIYILKVILDPNETFQTKIVIIK